MSWSFTGAPPNEGGHADPLDALELFLLTFWLGLRELCGGTSPLGGYRSYTRPFWVSVDEVSQHRILTVKLACTNEWTSHHNRAEKASRSWRGERCLASSITLSSQWALVLSLYTSYQWQPNTVKSRHPCSMNFIPLPLKKLLYHELTVSNILGQPTYIICTSNIVLIYPTYLNRNAC